MNIINVSIKRSNREGSCGIKTGNITIWVHNLSNPEQDLSGFLCHLVSVEFHEMGHRYDGLDHCSEWYADMTDRLTDYFYEHGFFA